MTPTTLTRRPPQTTRTTAERAPQTPEGSPAAHADAMAVASFVLGLVGTLAFNVVLGPCALVLATLALIRGTRRRGRALLGLALGAADLILLAALVTADGTVSWHIGG